MPCSWKERYHGCRALKIYLALANVSYKDEEGSARYRIRSLAVIWASQLRQEKRCERISVLNKSCVTADVRKDEERFAGLPAAPYRVYRRLFSFGPPHLEIVLKTRYDGSLAYPPKLLKKSI